MHLKAVEINGFKSFAEKINLDFNTGITSIVGPNGSGKSNILDAILWVLGEQSYKNIRAKESRDVIFSGGKNKKPKSLAEVSLYIDNSDRVLPLEIDDIKVTRRLHKTGENQYLINDTKARLKDISELFLDTGVGKSAYSVIGQGKVERIISSSSKEIKEIIEEAAGIKKVKIRKTESEKKLEKVQGEIEKIDLIIGEMEENKNRVEKQAEKALKYRELQSERDSLAKGIYERELEIKSLRLDRINETVENLQSGIEEQQKNFEYSEEKLEKANRERENLNEDIEAMTQKNIDLKKDIDKIINDKTIFTERIKSYERELVEKKDSLSKLEEKFLEKEREIGSLEIKESVTSEELTSQESENSKFELFISEKEEIKRENELSLNMKKDKLMTLEVDRLKFINETENTSRRMKSSFSKIETLKEEIEEYKTKISKNNLEIEKSGKEHGEKEKEYKGIDGKTQAMEEKITQVSLDMNKVHSQMRETDYNLKMNKTKLDNLVKLDENNEGFYKGVKEILNAGIEGVEGAFISLVNIPERYERAIEAAIPGNLQDIIVKDSKTAKKCINFLKEKRAGRASFLAFDTIKTGREVKSPNEKGIIGIAADLLEFPEKYASVVKFLLGNLLVVEDMDTALRISKSNVHRGNIVTISGELLSGRGRITGGENLRSASSQIFERKKEIKKLAEVVKKLNLEYKKQEKEYNKLTSLMEKTEEELMTMDDLKEKLRIDVKKLAELLEDLKSKDEKLVKGMKIVDMEIKEEELYISEYKKQEKNAHGKKLEVEEVMNNLRTTIEEDNKKVIKLKDEIESIKNDFSDKKINYMNNKEKLKQIQRELYKEKDLYKEMEIQRNSLSERVEKLYKGKEELSEKLDYLEKSFENENLRYEKEFLDIKSKKNRYSELEKEERELIKQVKNIENKIVIENNKLSQEFAKRENLEIGIENLKVKLNELVEAESKVVDGDLKEATEKLLKLEVRIKSLGTVNLLAIEEFQEIKNKYEFVLGQRNDLLSSEKSLRELIKEIEDIIEMRFFEAYKSINENFGYMCREILSNSEGKLELTNVENIKETGVELLVKYRNKKRQSITLLSGGEKSMVAVAFIMAIFMYKPSPFTFFDEIEAALDETNTKKLIRKLKEFTDKSQFILITHNKETMKESDTLYGVTMNKEIGESRIISVTM
ncbi:chromosome segregation protein SMC [Ilyobacter polytropus]|uniref:Chromosome partition protein Smc n=1 Tax=Ilyobacter polytropus (strain ATCC 51220 / DSM 2926 / LMG 16218 / CuHBu1) TaxID=572544 RepID=E3H7H1_ILYPC|nr:chromosome segregation protein SMC [Ilyobacter polytropus]ADO82867.1 chromosome segregation protein SMC [Ilyobacter polytropus DSM 2926]